MKAKPEITIEELVQCLHLGRTSVNQRVKELKDLGIVKREGRKNEGRWVVKE